MTESEKILNYLCQGMTMKEIADKLNISLPAIKWNIRNLRLLMGAKNTSHLISLSKDSNHNN
jgi:DNA-binding CsgD family transcriptional regulator